MVASPSARCRTHSSTLAGWFCEGCNSSLCPRCVAEESFSITRVETCCRCGERAVPLRLHRSHRSYASRLMDSWRFLAKGSTWVSIVALGVFSAAVLWIGGGLGALVVTGVAMLIFGDPPAAVPQVAVGKDQVSLGFAGELPW